MENQPRTTSLRRWMGYMGIGFGLLLILASFQGGWGKAYGQTVITPTPPLLIGDPQISKVGRPECCEPGDTVLWIVTVTNIGNADVTNVVVQDTLPPEVQLQQVTSTKGTVTTSGNSFEVRIDRVAPGEVVTIVAQAIVLGRDDDIVAHNTAYLRSDQGDRQASSDVLIKAKGGCPTPPVLPPTGNVEPEPAARPLLWLFVVGLLLLVVGSVLSLRGRGQTTER